MTIEVVFDGKTFVPIGLVNLPVGTKAEVAVSGGGDGLPSASPPPPPMTEQQKQDWERLCQQWQSTPPPFATVEEAMAYTRGRPWHELLLGPEPAEGNGT